MQIYVIDHLLLIFIIPSAYIIFFKTYVEDMLQLGMYGNYSAQIRFAGWQCCMAKLIATINTDAFQISRPIIYNVNSTYFSSVASEPQ